MLTIDSRQVAAHPGLLVKMQGIPHAVELIDAADYAFLDVAGNPIGIESKEVTELLTSLRSGRLERQLMRCSEQYTKVMLLVVGVYDMDNGGISVYRRGNKKGGQKVFFKYFSPPGSSYSQLARLLDRTRELGIEVVSAATKEASYQTVLDIYHQRRQPASHHRFMARVLHPSSPMPNSKIERLSFLIPRMPAKVGQALLDKFGSIKAIIVAPDTELLKTQGFGPGLLENLKGAVE